MPISFETFNQLDASTTGRLKLSGEQLVSGKQGFFGRLFSIVSGARQKENKAIYEEFTRALDSEFAGVGTDVLSSIKPDKRTKLSAKKIKQVIALASSVRTEYVRLRIPYNEKTRIGLCVDEHLVKPMEVLGKGGFNTVFRANYRRPDGSVFSGVYKEEAASLTAWIPRRTGIDEANPRFGLRNIATYQLDALLGLGVIPAAQMGIHLGKLGVVMELVPGSSLQRDAYRFEITADLGNKELVGLLQHKRMLEESEDDYRILFAQMYGLTSLEVVGGRLMATGDVDVDFGFSGHTLFEKLTDLQWLDALCGQGDRHAGNYIVEKDGNGSIRGLKGIDNDQSFGKALRDPNAIQFKDTDESEGFNGCSLPRVISRKTADAFLKLTFRQLEEALSGLLTDEEIAACKIRLNAIQGHIRALGKRAVIEDSQGWDLHNAQHQSFWDDVDASYVARELRRGLGPVVLAYRDVVKG